MSFSLLTTVRGAGSEPTRRILRLGPLGAGPVAVLLAVAYVLASLYFDRDQSFTPVVIRFIDPDDALRLAQVRTLLSGGGWFDPVIASIGEGGLHSHWSRLIDLPIAGLILAARLFADPARAEQIALLLWPKLVMLGFAIPLLRQMIRETGVEAAAAMLAMLWLAFFALVQFQLTRIDHHNIQIACATLAIVFVTSPLANARSAFAAGLIAGLGLAIGYEALPVIGLLAALLALCSLIEERRRVVAENFAAGLALTLAVGLVATVRPLDWLAAPCDALGFNVVAAVAFGAAGLIAVGRLTRSPTARLAAFAGVGSVAVAFYIGIEPACVAGPFAKLDPAQGDLWLNHVVEMRSLVRFAETMPSLSLAVGLSMLVCLAAQAVVAWRSRSVDEALRLAILVALTALGFRYLKMMPYVQVIGLYCLARAPFVVPPPWRQLTPRAATLLAVLLATPVPLTIGISALLPPEEKEEKETGGRACSAERDFGVLAALPPARILPQPDLGGYLALLAQHQVMIGNYHRLDREIMRAFAIFSATPDAAKRLLDDWRIDIVAHCAGRPIYTRRTGEGSLARAIENGEKLPDYLIPIDLGVQSGVRAWRVARP